MALDYKILGGRIKEARIRRGVTQRSLSKAMKISTAYVSRVERGQSKVNITRLVEISELLKTPLSYLVSGAVQNEEDYLNKEFKAALENCSPERQKVILEVVKLIAEI